MNSLFAHLAGQFGLDQAEDLASSGLAYVLQNSAVACSALNRIVDPQRSLGATEGRWVSQYHAPTGETPDLAFLDNQDQPVGLVEAKFWARLTPTTCGLPRPPSA